MIKNDDLSVSFSPTHMSAFENSEFENSETNISQSLESILDNPQSYVFDVRI